MSWMSTEYLVPDSVKAWCQPYLQHAGFWWFPASQLCRDSSGKDSAKPTPPGWSSQPRPQRSPTPTRSIRVFRRKDEMENTWGLDSIYKKFTWCYVESSKHVLRDLIFLFFMSRITYLFFLNSLIGDFKCVDGSSLNLTVLWLWSTCPIPLPYYSVYRTALKSEVLRRCIHRRVCSQGCTTFLAPGMALSHLAEERSIICLHSTQWNSMLSASFTCFPWNFAHFSQD
jgi:hypothetical protein